MWADDLRAKLQRDGEDAFYDLRYLETVDSTNDYIKRQADGAREGLLVVSDEQTAGRGRSGRAWASPKGEAAYFSFLLKPEVPPDCVSALTLVMGLSVAQAVRECLDLPVGIKWPNDIVIHHKKICGILTEAGARDGRIEWVVVGTGVNINNRSFPEELADRATSLFLEMGGREVPRAEITAQILRRFHRNYRIFLEKGSLAGLTGEYDRLLVGRGSTVRIEDPAGSYTAVSRGIDESGRLAVTLPDGREERIASGEVSVRGLYGYI